VAANARATLSVLAFSAIISLLVPIAHGAELGKLTVLSRLGQPLNAEIEIVSLKPGEDKGLAAQLASRQAFRQAGIELKTVHADLRISIERSGGRPVLRLRTTRRVDEAFVETLIELRSNASSSLSRYTVLLDPSEYKARSTRPETPAPVEKPAPTLSREDLFGVPRGEGAREPESKPLEWRGFVQNTLAYDYKDPRHWSRAVIRTQLGTQGGTSGLKWKATGRLDVDPVYSGGHFYPEEVRKDQRADFFLRETYLDTSAGGLEWRLGKQNIVWGEMVGLFFADVVSARDQRDFILPDFEIIRIPQWAARAEYFGDTSHAEVIWLPYPELDNIGKPGAEFFPYQIPPPTGFAQQFNNVVRPQRGLRHSNFGARASTLQNGWDLSAFYYRSTDVIPTFYREVALAPAPTLIFTPRHDRIWQTGGTLAKDFGSVVGKAEVIYTAGRKYNVTRLAEPTGVVPQNTLDYVLGLDFTLGRETRLNLQYFERVFFDHDPDLLQDRREGGVTLLLSGKLGAELAPELLIIQSVNRRDRLVRTKLGWTPVKNWRFTFGVDVFTGPVTGFFGRFDNRDRAYVETRYDF
jgi:hypothetical protein